MRVNSSQHFPEAVQYPVLRPANILKKQVSRQEKYVNVCSEICYKNTQATALLNDKSDHEFSTQDKSNLEFSTQDKSDLEFSTQDKSDLEFSTQEERLHFYDMQIVSLISRRFTAACVCTLK